MTREELVWLAGWLEGEGCFYARRCYSQFPGDPMMKRFLSFALAAFLACAPVQAQFFPFPGPGRAGAGGGGGLAITWQFSGTQNGSFASPVTFSSVPIGTASSDRIVNVHLGSSFGGFTNVDICGATGTLSVNDGAGSPKTASYYRNVTSGTTCTITVSGTGFTTVEMSVWTISGASGGGSATPTSTAYGTNPNAGNPNQLAVTVGAGGKALISSFGDGYASAGTPFTWTNTTNSGGVGSAYDSGSSNGLIASAEATSSATVTVTPTTISWGFGVPILYQTWGP